jgi:hypothetical protein
MERREEQCKYYLIRLAVDQEGPTHDVATARAELDPQIKAGLQIFIGSLLDGKESGGIPRSCGDDCLSCL